MPSIRPSSSNWQLSRATPSRWKFLDDWEARVEQYAGSSPDHLADQAVELIASKENLAAAWYYCARYGGHAPGSDDRSFRDYTRVQKFDEIDQLHRELTQLSIELGQSRHQFTTTAYQHGPVRIEPIPKRPGSSETRDISIPNCRDRCVGRAATQILEPLLAIRYEDGSFCRPRRSIYHALAAAKRAAETQQKWVWICQDVRDAFGAVNFDLLFDSLHRWLPSEKLLGLIRSVVGEGRSEKLHQGSPLSPSLMNLFLDDRVGRPWRERHPNNAMFRYMDDLLIPCNDVEVAHRLHGALDHRVGSIQLQLKYPQNDAVFDLRQRTASWLGYELSCTGGKLCIRLRFLGRSTIAKQWRRYLRERFAELHHRPDAVSAACMLINGIIDWAGPAYRPAETRDVYEVIRASARSADFEEIPAFERVNARWQQRYERWLEIARGEPEASCSGADQGTEDGYDVDGIPFEGPYMDESRWW